jgi:hypothetical protein
MQDNPLVDTDPSGNEPCCRSKNKQSGDCCGADVTNNLTAMVPDVISKFLALGYIRQRILVTETITPPFSIGIWDILGFAPGLGLDGPCANGTGKCTATATVAGKCFNQYAINYFLAGIIDTLLGGAASLFANETVGYTSLQHIISGDNASEKQQFFTAGYNANPAFPSQPKNLGECAVCTDPPKKKLKWTWGPLSGSD